MAPKSQYLAFVVLLAAAPGCRPAAGTAQEAMKPGALGPTDNTSATGTAPAAAQAGTGAASNTSPAPTSGGTGASLGPHFIFSPYKDLSINFNYQNNVISTLVTGTREPILQAWPSAYGAVWSFATGECGAETFGGISAAVVASTNIPLWTAAKRPYSISTGGAAGAFTCASDANFAVFLNRYLSPQLQGVDFDIEGSQTKPTISALVARVQAAQQNPNFAHLRFSFTIATLAGTSAQSLGPAGILVMQAIAEAGLRNYTINLMTMDYGSASATTCALNAAGACDMGASAVQAARNLHSAYALPYDQIEITPMLGGNDSAGQVFTLEDVATVVAFVKEQGLAGLHVWSLDRDMDCSQNFASPTCNSYGKAGALGFSKAIALALSQ